MLDGQKNIVDIKMNQLNQSINQSITADQDSLRGEISDFQFRTNRRARNRNGKWIPKHDESRTPVRRHHPTPPIPVYASESPLGRDEIAVDI